MPRVPGARRAQEEWVAPRGCPGANSGRANDEGVPKEKGRGEEGVMAGIFQRRANNRFSFSHELEWRQE